MSQYHLAVLTLGWIDLILDGKKTIESRFTKVRCAPYGKVFEGDTVYLKESGGPVKGEFRVAKVETFSDLTLETINEIDARYHNAILVDPLFAAHWDKWKVSKYATLIHVADPVRYENPFPFPKKDGRAWVVLEKSLV